MTELYRPSAGEHPITPPPELVRQWVANTTGPDYEKVIATQAARWGADQELETILEMVGVGQQSLPEEDRYLDGFTVASIRAARRPKPPSLKEQARVELDRLVALISTEGALAMAEPIRRALEALDD